MLLSIHTRPTSVPIIPHAGPMAPIVSQNPDLSLCLLSMLFISVSRIPRTSSGSVPSTMSIIPFFIKSSSRFPAASSRERSPSFLATFESSIIFVIISGTLTLTCLKISVILFKPPTKFAILTDIIVAKTDPPNVISADAGSRKYPRPLIPPEFIIP